jgi:hypothetical protein
LVAQARLSARHRISLHTVLRRYIAGSNLLRDFLIEESVGDERLLRSSLPSLLRSQSVYLERVLATVSDEYQREAADQGNSSSARLVKRVQQLLAGEQIEIPELAYDFDANHLGVIARGPEANQAVRTLGNALNCRSMVVFPSEETVWAWFGSRSRPRRGQLDSVLSMNWPKGIPLALGEVSAGSSGWRLTHQQARAAFPVALRGETKVVRYANVALLASMAQDELLSASLRDLYLTPLLETRDGGAVFRDTLRAYFAADRNTSATAAALRVSRQTISNRLRAIEERIERPLLACAGEIEAALRIEEIEDRLDEPGGLPLT